MIDEIREGSRACVEAIKWLRGRPARTISKWIGRLTDARSCVGACKRVSSIYGTLAGQYGPGRGRIVRVYATPIPRPVATYELGDATLLPGLLDAHVHVTSYVRRNRNGDAPEQAALAQAGNLYATLMGA